MLTGETGAGKSILVDALQLALGARAAVRIGVGTTPWASASALETATVDFYLTSGRALGCWDFFREHWTYLDACAGLDAGAVTTTSDGLSSTGTTARLAAWASSELRWGVLLGPVVPEIHGFFAPALTRDRYRATDTSGAVHTVHRTPAFRFGAGLAVGARFP